MSFDPRHAPLRVMNELQMGEFVMGVSPAVDWPDEDAAPTGVPQPDPRVPLLQQQLDLLTIRVHNLEEQTWRRRWQRLQTWWQQQWRAFLSLFRG